MTQSLRTYYRTPVRSAKGKPIGRVLEVLFDASDAVVVGFIVERPRLLMLLDRRDRYLTRDRSSMRGDVLQVTEERGAWDKAAAKRLGIDWDTTVVWSGMPVRTESGTKLGQVGDGLFDAETGRLEALRLSGGVAADVTLGTRDLPARLVRGYEDGFVVVGDEAAEAATDGGAAAAAGKTAAVAKVQVEQAAKTAVAYGKAAAKVASESKTGKKAIGWFKSMRDEIVDAMGDPDDD